MTTAIVGVAADAAGGAEAAGSAAAAKAATRRPTAPTREPRPPKSTGGKGGGKDKGKSGGGGTAAGLGMLAGGHKSNRATRGAMKGQRLLVVEFLLCVIVLALSPLTDQHKADTPAAWMKRATGVSALFLILGMVGAAGPRAAKVAAGLGGIVCTTLLVTDRSIFVAIANRFGAPPPAGPAGPTGGDVPTLYASQPGLPDTGSTPTLYATQPGLPDLGSAPTLPGTAVRPGRSSGPFRFE